MQFSISTKVSIRISNLSQTFTVHFNKIQSSKSFSTIYNTKILLKKFKTFYLSQTAALKPWIKKFYPDNKENSYCQDLDKFITTGYYLNYELTLFLKLPANSNYYGQNQG